jgi:MFS family permease
VTAERFSLKQFSVEQILQTVGLLLIAMMGAAVTTLMPLLVGAYSDSGLFTDQQVGWLTSADVAGILLASASAFFWSRKVNWRWVTIIGIVGFIVANWLSTSIEQFHLLFMVRFAAGVACGATYAISLAALGDYQRTDRAFGAVVTIQVIFGTVGFWLLPTVLVDFGLAGMFQFFNLCLIPTLLCCLITFPSNKKTAEVGKFTIDGSLAAALYIFIGVVIYYFAQGTVWAYLERIGVTAHLSGADIGVILGLGFAISALGSMLSGYYVEKLGRNSGLYLTAIIQIPCLAALYFMGPDNAYWIYAVTTIVYQVMWSFIVPIMMAIFNEIDKSGKLIVLCVSAFKVGLVVGPPVAGWVVTHFHVNEVLWIGGIAIVMSVAISVKSNQILTNTTPLDQKEI